MRRDDADDDGARRRLRDEGAPDEGAPDEQTPDDRVHDLGATSLRDYAMVADGERGALLDPTGNIAWLCAPTWDSPPLFAALLGGPGSYEVRPVGRSVWGGHHEAGGLIWQSRWVTDADAVVESREALAFPGDPDTLVLLRCLRARRGEARVRAVLDLRGVGADPADPDPAGARGPRDLHRAEDGSWTMRVGALHVRWSGSTSARAVETASGPVLQVAEPVTADRGCDLVLEVSTRPLGRPLDVAAAWESTESAWASAVPPLPGALDERDARHSAAVLAGMTSPATGATVAAATTGIPERAKQGRDYDYRYAWIRDQTYAGIAAYAAGIDGIGDGAVRFVSARLLADGSGLSPAYTTRGGPIPRLGPIGLPGYPGGSGVRGNPVRDQHQLDVFGEALALYAEAAERDRVDADALRGAAVAVAAVEELWDVPDAGIWELDDRWWTHSRLACVAGLRQWSRSGRLVGLERRAAGRAAELADRLLGQVLDRCVGDSGALGRAADDPRPDAALVIASVRGGLPWDHPVARATLAAVQDQLSVEGYVYRFAPDDRPLGEAEGSFLLCTFWLALAEAQAGQTSRSLRRLERALASCGTAALFSEEFDVAQRQLRGNLPQAFVHALALEACVRIPRQVPASRDDGF